MKTGDVAQVVKCLLCKGKALNSNSRTTKKKKKKKNKQEISTKLTVQQG
jgi:hypothetical protein